MKKIISLISAVAVFASMISCIFSTPLMILATSSVGEYDSAELDFENGNGFLDFGTHWNTYNKDFDGDGDFESAYAEVMTENQGTANENKYLRIQNQYYKNLIVNFPFELENGATYRISYKIRDDGNSNLSQSDTKGSGIYVGKSTGQTALSENAQRETGDYLGTKLHNLYGSNGSYVSLSKSDFTDVSYTFTVGEDAVDDDFKYLAINYYCTEKNGSKYEWIDIDDIKIYKLKNSAVYDFESGMNNIAVSSTKAKLTAEITADGEDNNVLSVKTDATAGSMWANTSIVFPVKLKVGKSYEIKYRYRATKFQTSNHIQLNFDSAWSAGKIDSGKAVIQTFTGNNAAQKQDYTNIIAYFTKLPDASQYTASGNYDWNGFKLYKSSNSDWKEVSFVFTATDDYVTDEYNLAALRISLYSVTGETKIDIDDVSISQMPAKVNVIANDPTISVAPVYGNNGEEIDLPNSYQPGYNFLGWYTDKDFSIPYVGTKITMTDDDVTLYAKYERVTSAVVDFEDTENPNYSFSDTKPNWDNTNREIPSEVTSVEGVDGETTNALKLHAYNYHLTAVLLPIKIEEGRSYTVSFDYKSDTTNKITLHRNSRIAASTRDLSLKTTDDAFSYITGGSNVTYLSFSTDEWQHFEDSFTIEAGKADADYGYLALAMSAINTGAEDYYLYLDNIIVKEVSSVLFVSNISDITIDTIVGEAGSTRNLDCLSVYGYEVEGIYTDSAFTVPYEGDNIVIESSAKTLYVKYKETDNSVLRFENGTDVVKTSGSFSIAQVPKDDGSANKALSLTKGTSFAVLPYTLEPNKDYVLTFKYKASSVAVSPRLYVVAGNAGEGSIVENGSTKATRQFSVFGTMDTQGGDYVTVTDFDWQWRTVTYKFTTNDTVTDTYNHMVLAGEVAFNVDKSQNGYLYIDDLQLKAYTGEIKFDVSYDGYRIDVNSMYPEIGETVTLPKSVIEPFSLEGWYLDAAFTQKVTGDTYTVAQSSVTLYGKVSKKNTVHIDFEDPSQILFSYAHWSGVGGRNIEDFEDPDNHLLRMTVTPYNRYAVRLNYQWLPNRIYKVTLRYRSVNNQGDATAALLATGVVNADNGYGSEYHKSSMPVYSSVVPIFTQQSVPSSWTEITATVPTDQPEIDSDMKYLSVYLDARLEETCEFEIDDIIITDTGAFDPSELNVLDSYSWPDPKEDMSVWTDSAKWITGIYTQNADNSNDFTDNDEEYSDVEGDDEEISKSQTQRRRKKRVVVITKQGSWMPLIIGISVAAVVVAAGVVLLIVIIKRKKKQAKE